MKKRNITLTSILLLILAIIIGIILSTTQPGALREASLGLRTAGVTSLTDQGGPDVLGRQALTVDSQGVDALRVEVLNHDAVELSGASLDLLET